MAEKIRVTVWNEFRHEKTKENVKALYPNGLHAVVGEFLSETGDMEVTLAALDDEAQGLPDEVLDNTDVLVWWGHMAHKEVNDELVAKIQKRVYLGKMGFVGLHSAHHSKPFRAIVGTNGNLQWGRNQREVVWNLMPSEPFYIPQPDALVFGSWFEDGNILRSGCCFIRGAGKVFWFQPGHETCKSFFNPYVRKIITNAVYWATPSVDGQSIPDKCPHITEPIIGEFGKE